MTALTIRCLVLLATFSEVSCDRVRSEARSERSLAQVIQPIPDQSNSEDQGGVSQGSRERPTALLVSSNKSPTNANPITVSAVFSEEVSELESGDFAVKNCRVTAVEVDSESALRYNVALVPLNDGDVEIGLPENMATTKSGKGNFAAPAISFAVDTVAPRAILAWDTPITGGVTQESPIYASLTLSEPIPGLVTTSFTVLGGVVMSIAAETSKKYTIAIVPTQTNEISVSLDASAVADSAGNGNEASNQIKVQYAGPPTAVLQTLTKSPTKDLMIPVTLIFSEQVNGFALDDLQVNGGSAGNLQSADEKKYTFEITAGAQGTISVSVPAAAATSTLANLPSKAAKALSFVHDSQAPVPTIAGLVAGTTYKTQLALRILWSEPVTGFSKDDIVVSNATIKTFKDSGNGVFDLEFSPIADDLVTVDVPGGVAQDLSQNQSAASPERYSVTYSRVNYATQILPSVATKCAPCHAAAGPQASKYAENNKAVWDAGIGAIKARVGNGSMPPAGAPNGVLTDLEKDLILNYLP